MRSRFLLFLLAALAGLGLLAWFAQRSAVRATEAASRAAPDGSVEGAEATLESEDDVQRGASASAASLRSGTDATRSDESGPSVRGIVLDPEGQPVPRGTAYCSGGVQANGRPIYKQYSLVDDGRFVFRLPRDLRGQIQLRARGGEWEESEATMLELAEIEGKGEIRLVLRPHGSVRGIALDRLGRPMEGHLVLLDPYEARPGHGVACATVGKSGEFALENLSAGRHQLCLKPGHGEELYQECARLLELADGLEASTEVDIRAAAESRADLGGPSPGCVRVHGQITRSTRPVPGAWIWVESDGGTRAALLSWTRCDAEGRYELGIEHAGPTHFHVGPGRNAASLARWAEVPARAEFQLDLELADGRIACRVLDLEGKPLQHEFVTLVLHESFADAGVPTAESLTVRSDAEGRVEFNSLAPGTYELRGGGRGHGCVSSGRIELAAGAVRDDLVLRVGSACTLEGKLIGGPEDRTLDGFVDVFDAGGNYVARVGCDADLFFHASELAEGEYRLCSHVGGLASSVSDPIPVKPGNRAWVELTLQSATEVFVQVVESSGAHLERFRESIRAAPNLTLSEGDVDWHGELAPDAIRSEWVSLGSFPPGAFVLTVRAADGRTAQRQLELSGESRREVTVQLPPSGTAESAR